MRRGIAFLAVVLLAFAACGGEKDTTTTPDKGGEQTAKTITYTCAACSKEKTPDAGAAVPS